MAASVHKLHVGGAPGEEQPVEAIVAYLQDPQAAGDYYTEGGRAFMRWITTPRVRGLFALGESVRASDMASLLAGKDPVSGQLIRRVGPDGRMVGGIDVTLSPAPKSVSVLWALGDWRLRAVLEEAVILASNRAIGRMLEEQPLGRERYGRGPNDVRAVPLGDYVGVQVLHTTARLARGARVPDPQLHVHNVLMGGVTAAGRLRAIDSRAVLRYRTELDAEARGHLAEILRRLGFEIARREVRDERGRVQRIEWEIAGVPAELRGAMSSRTAETAELEQEYRELTGRPASGPGWEKFFISHRGPKAKLTQEELNEHWAGVGAGHGLSREDVQAMRDQAEARGLTLEEALGLEDVAAERQDQARELERTRESPEAQRFKELLVEEICRDHAYATERQLETLTQQLAIGLVGPRTAGRALAQLVGEGDLLITKDGHVTTLEVLAAEQRAERAARRLLDAEGEESDVEAVEAELIRRRMEGRPLGDDQAAAVRAAVSGGRLVSVTGPAGTGKGYATQAMVSIWRRQRRRVIAVAVAGRTAQQAQADSGADQGMTLDGLKARVASGSVQLRRGDVVLVDEAGMVDHSRYADLLEVVESSGATLVQIGDAAQLSPVGPGGLWTVVHELAEQERRAVELEEVRRARDPREAQAWADLRDGRTDEALIYYSGQGRLHLYETRRELQVGMVDRWWEQAREAERDRLPLMVVDTSNQERDELNRQAQERRLESGQLGAEALELKSGRELHTGDQVLFSAIHRPEPESDRGRVENGTLATVAAVDVDQGTAELVLHEPAGDRRLVVDRAVPVELGYARHVAKAQGVTVDEAQIAISERTARNDLYVMASRAREGAHVHALRPELAEMAEASEAEQPKRAPSTYAFRARRANENVAEYETARAAAHESEQASAASRAEQAEPQAQTEGGEPSAPAEERETVAEFLRRHGAEEAERELVMVRRLGQDTQRSSTKEALGRRELEDGRQWEPIRETAEDRREGERDERLDVEGHEDIARQASKEWAERPGSPSDDEVIRRHRENRRQAAERDRARQAEWAAEHQPEPLMAASLREAGARTALANPAALAQLRLEAEARAGHPLPEMVITGLGYYQSQGQLEMSDTPAARAVERLAGEPGAVLIVAGADEEAEARQELGKRPELAQDVEARGRLQRGREAYEERQQRREAWLGPEAAPEQGLMVEPGALGHAYVLANRPGPELVRASSVAARSHLIMATPAVVDQQRILSRAAELHQAEQQRTQERTVEAAVDRGVTLSHQRTAERQAERSGEREVTRSGGSGSRGDA